jgi:folate-binding protein YgfZ
MESDLNLYCLQDELLLDFEPGLTQRISQCLEKYIVADDVQVVDVAPSYGLLSVQGPQAPAVLRAVLAGLGPGNSATSVIPPQSGPPPAQPFASVKITDTILGEIYLANQPRFGGAGFDLFVPSHSLKRLRERLEEAAQATGGRACGWDAAEMARVEAGIPRFGLDMDETNFPQECGIEGRAVSYTKGCYVGQEVLNRIHTIGHVNRQLRGLRLADWLSPLPNRGDKLYHNGKEAGYTTSALQSTTLKANIALGYVRKDANQIGTELVLRTASGESPVRVVELPFVL